MKKRAGGGVGEGERERRADVTGGRRSEPWRGTGGTHWAMLRSGGVRTLHDAPGASAAAAADARRSVLEAMR